MTIRHCSRCGKELTDAASKDCGVGPVCRQMDNHVYAVLLPANTAAALDEVMVAVESNPAPETLDTLTKVVDALMVTETADWRLQVNRMDWALSYVQPVVVKDSLIGAMKALGYVGLAMICDGKAATGEATLVVANGRLVLHGPNNAHARLAMKKIVGWRFEKANKNAWTFPPSAFEAVKNVMIAYYPNHTIDWAQVWSDATAASLIAKAVVTANPAPAKTAPTTKVVVKATIVEAWTPYSTGFVNAIKAELPIKERRFVQGRWEADAKHLDAVVALIEKHYGAKPVIENKVAAAA